jgi:hypothetical protein
MEMKSIEECEMEWWVCERIEWRIEGMKEWIAVGLKNVLLKLSGIGGWMWEVDCE